MAMYDPTPSAPKLEDLLEDYCMSYEEFRRSFVIIPPLPPIDAQFQPLNQEPRIWTKFKTSFKKTKLIFKRNAYKRL